MNQPEISLKGKKILVVDDVLELRNLITTILSAHGAITTEASNGKEALNALSDSKPDAIMIDYHMPIMDGLTAAKIIKECRENKDVPIVLFSSDHTELDLIAKEALYIAEVLYKPFSIKDVLEKTVKVLSDSKNFNGSSRAVFL